MPSRIVDDGKPGIVGGTWRCLDKLGEGALSRFDSVTRQVDAAAGSFGAVYSGVSMDTDKPVAIKMESRDSEPPQLKEEYRTYKNLKGCPGVPQVYFYGVEGNWNCLVMDLLGKSIEDMFDMCDRKFCVKTVAVLAAQMIRRVQTVHENDLVYRDIKPDNFMLGVPKSLQANDVSIIDFGMAKLYRDPVTKKHASYREKRALTGTARYMSINTHLGREQSRRDDLEALGHVFIYLLHGKLPWQGLKAPTSRQKYTMIGEKKQSTSIKELCRGLPHELAQYLSYACKLRYDELPDYKFCIDLMKQMLKNSGERDDQIFEWTMRSKGYKLVKKLGEGSFGAVFKGVRTTDGAQVAIKLEDRKSDVPQLVDEYKTYKLLEGQTGIPQVYYFGQEGPWNCLALELLGKSLEDWLDVYGRHFSLKTVAMCAKQMLARVQSVHQHNLLYRDIKPDNFMSGAVGSRSASTIYLIDFGLAAVWRNPKTKQHIKYREGQPLEGTARYLSVNAHRGIQTSRRDDLESLGYVCIYLARGQLPWQGIKGNSDDDKYKRIGEMKRNLPIRELCRGLPRGFEIYLQYVRRLRFDEAPDFSFCRRIFSEMLADLGEHDDGVFDWNTRQDSVPSWRPSARL